MKQQTTKTDYKADNSRLNDQIIEYQKMVADRDRSVELMDDQLKKAHAEITELKRIQSVSEKYSKQVEKERDAKKQMLNSRNVELKTTNDELAIARSENDILNGKWYVRLFKKLGL